MSKGSNHKWGRYFLLVTVLTTAIIGGAFVFAPQVIPGIFSQDYVEPSARFYLRFLGAAMFGYSILNGFGLNYYDDFQLRQIICKANVTSLSIALLVSINGLATGLLSNFAWVFVAEHTLFLAGFMVLLRTTRIKNSFSEKP